MAGILAVGEVTDGRVASVTHELTAAGKTLDQTLGEGVSVVLMGEGIANLASEVTARGADKVYLVDDPLLKDSQIDASLAVLKRLCDEISPSVVLVGKSLAGRDIGPRLAFRLGVTVAQDCSDLNVDANTKRLVAHRPVYGGNAIAVVAFPSDDPQVAVLRAKAFEPLESDSSRQAEVVNFPAGIDDSVVKARVIETVKEEAEGVRLEDAEIVISGGRGLGGPEPFKDLEELAGLLGAAGGRLPSCVRRRMAGPQLPGGPDRQDHNPQPLHHRRHLRGQPAHGRLLWRQGHRRDQQGQGRQHLQGGPLRRHRRLAEGASLLHGNGSGAGQGLDFSISRDGSVFMPTALQAYPLMVSPSPLSPSGGESEWGCHPHSKAQSQLCAKTLGECREPRFSAGESEGCPFRN